MSTAQLVLRELHRVVSLPTCWLVAACGLVSVVSMTGGLRLLDSPPVGSLVYMAMPLVGGVLGALVAGADLKDGTLHVETMLLGGRGRQWTVATIALVLLAAAVGVICVLAGTAMSCVLGPASRCVDGAGGLLGGMMLVSVAWALLGAALTAATGSSVGGLVTTAAWLMVAEPLATAILSHETAAWLPGQASTALALGGATSRGGAVVVLLAAAAVALVVAGTVARRRTIPVTAR